MFIKTVVIKNFRALEDITFELNSRINVIVGPNAIGKTTILQAIRLLKALLAPRSPQEAQQTMISLGAASPHFRQRVFLGSLARDLTKDIEIRCTYCLSDNEISQIDSEKDLVIQQFAQAQLGQSFADPSSLIQFLESPLGKQARAKAESEIESTLKSLKSDKTLILGLTLKPASGQITALSPLSGMLLSYLDQRLPPHNTIFSFFPADRALPVGEVAVQLGAADTQQQIESHNSQPQIKFNRLKNLIFNSIVMGPEQRQAIIDEFDTIFKEILRGRRIKTIGINELGLLSIMIEELETGRQYEIDSLSSGEKGLALTFLIVAKTITPGGIVLLDEPELHLNPAVSRDVLSFMMKRYAKPLDIQFIICTHSPEILSGAFQDEECALFHVVSERTVARVGHKALDEYSDALLKLGTTVSEGLLYKGTFFVEGDDDVAFLEDGFGETLKRYRIKDRGGRKEVEKAVQKLQEIELKGERVDPVFLVFDRDDEITGLRSSAAVRILQWNRRCMENYLIDTEVIASLFKNAEVTATPITNEGEISERLRRLALSQLYAIVAKEIYNSYGYQSPGLRSSDVRHNSIEAIADALYLRVQSSQSSLNIAGEAEWKRDFVKKCKERRAILIPIWESKWKEECDGKVLFSTLQKEGNLKISSSNLKKRIVQEMRNAKSENWRIVNSLLQQILAS